MLERFRQAWARLLTPPARAALGLGISADAVTWIGCLAVVVIAMVCLPQGWFVAGALLIALASFTDLLDGQMARLSGTQSRWGAFLDSTLDRVADGAVFAGLLVWWTRADDPAAPAWAAVTAWALVAGQVTSYAKARAEAEGGGVGGGLAARADRIVILLAGVLLEGLGLRGALPGATLLLAVLSTITVVQRMVAARRTLGRN